MNRIIVIGNGFDLAHKLKTSYKDFIDTYWNDFYNKVFTPYFQSIRQEYAVINTPEFYEDEFAYIEKKSGKITHIPDESSHFCEYQNPYGELHKLIKEYNQENNINITIRLKFKNGFWEQISNQCSLMSWLDIENEYYAAIKKLSAEEDSRIRNKRIKKLNEEFDAVKKLLEAYLNNVTKNTKTKKHQSIQDAFLSLIEFDDIANRKQNAFLDSILSEMDRFNNIMEVDEEIMADPSYQIYSEKEAYRHYILEQLKNNKFRKSFCTPHNTLVLNFNYTKTAEQLYVENDYEVINIHGELNSKSNSIIFGYGDELDDDYRKIEKLQDNDFLENIKSIQYHKTRNYKNLLNFIEYEPYQIFVMGHSCGNSDRTLLNTLFEHENCVSVKVFYRQFEDGSDDHSNLIRNISRNFNDKPRMRDVVVDWEDCSPLVPVTKPKQEYL